MPESPKGEEPANVRSEPVYAEEQPETLTVQAVIAQLVESALSKKVAAFPMEVVAAAELYEMLGFEGADDAALRAVEQSLI